MRRLNHAQLFVFEEPAHGQLQERAGWHVVAVKNSDKFAGGLLQRIVDVTGFRVLVGRPCNIANPTSAAKALNAGRLPSSRM